MKFTDAYKGSFLKAADLKDGARNYVIDSIGPEEVGGETKIVMRFTDTDQALVLNKTNAGILLEVWGDEMDDWAGKQVLLKLDKTELKGKKVDCIRLSVPQDGTPGPRKKADQEEVKAEDVNL
jgi:hypothetical protein